MIRTRMDVWSLTRKEGDWPAVLTAYELGVTRLRDLDPPTGRPQNPLGWRYLAAMHGIAGPNGRPDTSDPLWSNCQHGSWYFLPWHRMYLSAFELIVQHAIEDDTWSLPYWYTLDPDDLDKLVLPPAFRDITLADNQLFTDERAALANSGDPIPDLTYSVRDALAADLFSTADGLAAYGGGERSTPAYSGGEAGLLENTPHGAVHVLVGNDYDEFGRLIREGWMGRFETAALDPVFWLHHANIDRLWQVWLDANPDHQNPTGDSAWFNTEFSFPAAGGGLVTWKVGEVLDTVALGYEYESTEPPSEVVPGPARVAARPSGAEPSGPEVTEPPVPQLLGATAGVALASSEPVDVEMAEPAGIGAARTTEEAGTGGGRVYLRVEGMSGTAAAPVYEVYVNVPAGDDPTQHPELRAGSLSTFGLVETSRTGAGGKTAAFDITSVRDALLEQGRWDPARLQVTFRPVAPTRPSDPTARARLEAVEGSPPDVRADRIAVIAT